MTWAISVFRGDPDDLSDERRFAALDFERARGLIRAEGGTDDGGRQFAIETETILTQITAVLDDAGVLRALESELYWEDAPAAVLREGLRGALDLFLRLAEELGADVFDHDSWRFITRADVDPLLESYVPHA